MRVGCVICGDLFVPSDDISATPCGHTFHSLCLMQWIEQSKSCPQCRHKATQKSLVKLFFDSVGSDSSEIDPDTLQHQIDNLKFQIRLKEQEILNTKESNSTLTTQNKGLREEFKVVEKKLRDKESTNLALRSQLKFMDQYKAEAEKAKETAKNLRNQLSVLQHVEMIVSGTNCDVESMLMSYTSDADSLRSLATFCSILKKELHKISEDKKRFRDEASSLRMKIKDVKHNYNDSANKLHKTEQVNKLLQEDLLSLEQENKSLKKKVDALQNAIASPSGDVKNSALHRLIAESPAPAKLKKPQHSSSDDEVLALTPEIVKKMSYEEEADDDSPQILKVCTQMELQFESPPKKTKSIILPGRAPLAVTTNIPKSKSVHHNIFAKSKAPQSSFSLSQQSSKTSLSGLEHIGYDGFGGHHKVDEFPKPRPIFLKKKSGIKVISKGGSSGKTQKTTLKNFFQNTFEDGND